RAGTNSRLRAMWLSNLIFSVGRAVAIEAFEVLSRAPSLTAAMPDGKLKRLGSTAGLPDLHYEAIYTQSVYAPWRTGNDFLQALSEVRGNTLVDEYRCWELWDLVGQSRNLPAGDILEVGVWRGGTGCLMARRSALVGATSSVYLCDTFAGVVKVSERDS